MSNGIAKITYQNREKLKVFVDEGNNSRLVNELMRRRVGIKIVSTKK
jgi:transcription antitermination factor NusA-like protein